MDLYINPNKRSADFTADPSKYPQGYFKQKKCRMCGTEFAPLAPSHLYCSDKCADTSKSEKYLKTTYGMTLACYQRMLEDQGHLCAICRKPGFLMREHHKIKLVVDHCHSTGVVRGLLCHNCNRGLGLFHDNTETLKTAIRYLEGATTIPLEEVGF